MQEYSPGGFGKVSILSWEDRVALMELLGIESDPRKTYGQEIEI